MSEAKLFSPQWCEMAKGVWEAKVVPRLVEPETYNYIIEFRAPEIDAACQIKAVKGAVVEWDSGRKYSDDEATFLIDASAEVWRKIAEGKLDPVGAIAAKRIHLRKGPMTVVIKESKAFTALLEGFGDIPTEW